MHEISFSEAVSFLHHGIEGQKWGVRNGPPYPLDRAAIAKDIKSKAKEVKKEDKKALVKSEFVKGLAISSVVGSFLAGPIGSIVASSIYVGLNKNSYKYKDFKSAKESSLKSDQQYKNAKDLVKKFNDYSITDKQLEGLMRDYEKANNALEKEKSK